MMLDVDSDRSINLFISSFDKECIRVVVTLGGALIDILRHSYSYQLISFTVF